MYSIFSDLISFFFLFFLTGLILIQSIFASSWKHVLLRMTAMLKSHHLLLAPNLDHRVQYWYCWLLGFFLIISTSIFAKLYWCSELPIEHFLWIQNKVISIEDNWYIDTYAHCHQWVNDFFCHNQELLCWISNSILKMALVRVNSF